MPLNILPDVSFDQVMPWLPVLATPMLAGLMRAKTGRREQFDRTVHAALRELEFFEDRIRGISSYNEMIYVNDAAFREVKFAFDIQGHVEAGTALHSFVGDLGIEIWSAKIDTDQYLWQNRLLRVDAAGYMNFWRQGVCARVAKRRAEFTKRCADVRPDRIVIWFGQTFARWVRPLREEAVSFWKYA